MGRLAPMTDYDPGFRFAEAGLRIDTDLLERARRLNRMTRKEIGIRAGYAHGPSTTVNIWTRVMQGRVRTTRTLARVCDVLGVDLEEALIEDGSVPGEA